VLGTVEATSLQYSFNASKSLQKFIQHYTLEIAQWTRTAVSVQVG